MTRETMFGIPVVTATNCLMIGEELGVRTWQRLSNPEATDTYLQGDRSAQERDEVERFAPKSEVVIFEQPNGTKFTGLRTRRKDYAGMFVLLPGDFVVLTIDFMHGTEVITVVPPCGVPEQADYQARNPMLACARREFEEETGLQLKLVEPLTESPLEGIGVSSRNDTSLCFPFWGELKQPITRNIQRLDDGENLAIVTMHLAEWLKFLKQGRNINSGSITLTMLALMRMGRVGQAPSRHFEISSL